MRAGRLLALRRAPQLAVSLAFATALLLSVAPIGLAHAATPATTANPSFVAAVQSALVAPGTDVPVSAEITNPGTSDLLPGTVTVALSTEPLGSAQAVTDWVTNGGFATGSLARVSTLPVPASGTTMATVAIPAGAFSGTGVWGIQSTLTVSASQYLSRTVVVVTEGVGAVDVSAIVAITAPQQPAGLLDSATLADLTNANGDLTRQLDAISGTSVTVALDPRIVASIRALGSNAPQSATAWLERLQASNIDSFALQYGDADPALQAQLGAPSLLGPGDFTDLGLSASALASVSSFPYTRSVLWPAASSVVSNDVAVFEHSGYQNLLLSSNNVSDPVNAAAHVSNSTAFIAQEAVSAALASTFSASSATGWLAGMNQLQATLAFYAGQHIVVTSNRAVAANVPRAQSALGYLSSSAQAHLSALATVNTAAAPSTTIADRPESDARLASGRHILDRTAAVTAFSTVAVTPTDLSNPMNRQALAVLGVGWMDDTEAWMPAVAAFDVDSAAVLNGVSVASSSTINVLATEASLPFTIENTLATPVHVWVTVTPSNGRIVVGEPVETDVAAKSRQTVRLPVKARIGSGAVALTVSLSASNGMAVGTPTVVQANVQADWEGWGAAIIALIAAALFGFGIWRQVRRVRRNRAGEAADSGEAPEAANE